MRTPPYDEARLEDYIVTSACALFDKLPGTVMDLYTIPWEIVAFYPSSRKLIARSRTGDFMPHSTVITLDEDGESMVKVSSRVDGEEIETIHAGDESFAGRLLSEIRMTEKK